MAEHSNKFLVTLAVTANVAIAVSKFVVAGITGSAAMVAEGVHSTVDVGNGGLLLLGEHLSKKPADQDSPFGHGREVFFWSFVVALVIFGVGGGVSIFRGLVHLAHPAPLENALWNYVVLGIAFVLDGTSWIFTFRGFRQRKPAELSAWQYFRKSREPSVFTVLMEDTTDLIGLLIAFAGVFVGHTLRNPYADGIASVLIGVMLAAVALVLGYETRGLLMGEAADPKVVRGIRERARAVPGVREVGSPMTVYVAPHEMVLALAVEFDETLTAGELMEGIERVEAAIREKYPDVRRIFVEARRLRPEDRADHLPA